jgi:hypothetical protein
MTYEIGKRIHAFCGNIMYKLRVEVTLMGRKENKHKLFEDPKGIAAVQNQLFESYQSGVVEDQLHNNRGIWTFNNRKN